MLGTRRSDIITTMNINFVEKTLRVQGGVLLQIIYSFAIFLVLNIKKIFCINIGNQDFYFKNIHDSVG